MIKIIEFFKKKYAVIILALIFSFVLYYSLSGLAARPRLWNDEGFNIEVARNFLLFQKLNIMTAPGVFAPEPYVMSTTGYPVTVPLSGFFYFFGFGLFQARAYMIFWVLLAVYSVFYFSRAIFGEKSALATTALFISFASFYDSGLAVMGEIPGFIFFIWGLYFLTKKESFFWSGLFLGLAAVAKPSIYLLAPLAFLIYILISRKDLFRRFFRFSIGAAMPVLLDCFILIPNIFSWRSWLDALNYYRNPFMDATPVSVNIWNNLLSFFHSTTLIYFALIIFIIIFSFWQSREIIAGARKEAVSFCFIYGLLIAAYFLKSPGWFRYLLPLQLIAFIFIVPAVSNLFEKYGKYLAAIKIRRPAIILFSAMIVLQLYVLFFNSDILVSAKPIEAIDFLKTLNGTVGVINLPHFAAFSAPGSTYQVIRDARQGGENPLSFSKEKLPDYILSNEKDPYALAYGDVLSADYLKINQIGKVTFYARR